MRMSVESHKKNHVLWVCIDTMIYPRTLEQVGGLAAGPELPLLAGMTVSSTLPAASQFSTIQFSYCYLFLSFNIPLTLSFVCISGSLSLHLACPDFQSGSAVTARGHTRTQKLHSLLHRPPSRSTPALWAEVEEGLPENTTTDIHHPISRSRRITTDLAQAHSYQELAHSWANIQITMTASPIL